MNACMRTGRKEGVDDLAVEAVDGAEVPVVGVLLFEGEYIGWVNPSKVRPVDRWGSPCAAVPTLPLPHTHT